MNNNISLFGSDLPGSRLIMFNNNIAGMIDYNIYDDVIFIQFITIDEKYRKLGIARKIINEIIGKNKGKRLYGEALSDAKEFWSKLGATFEDPKGSVTPFHINC